MASAGGSNSPRRVKMQAEKLVLQCRSDRRSGGSLSRWLQCECYHIVTGDRGSAKCRWGRVRSSLQSAA